MITDEVVEACEMMIKECDSYGLKLGMKVMLDMLVEFAEDEWVDMTPEKRRAWVCEYMKG